MELQEIYNNLMYANFLEEELDIRIKRIAAISPELAEDIDYVVNECDLFDEEGEHNLTALSKRLYNMFN